MIHAFPSHMAQVFAYYLASTFRRQKLEGER